MDLEKLESRFEYIFENNIGNLFFFPKMPRLVITLSAIKLLVQIDNSISI